MPDHTELDDFINQQLKSGYRPHVYQCDPKKHNYCDGSEWCQARGGPCHATVCENYAVLDEHHRPVILYEEEDSK